jgi:hypothetical protein
MIRRILFLGTVVAAAPPAVLAQRPDTASEGTALAYIRERGSPVVAIRFLAQEDHARSPQQLDTFADSLVVVATSYRRGGPVSAQRAALAAANALVGAATAEHPEERGRGGTSYPRAFERLARIYEGSETGIQGATLWLMTELPERGRVIGFLAEVASSPGSAAATAVRHLGHDTGPAGIARLRLLYETDAVVDATAREHLEGFAQVHGWRR